jgi:hypothetical protein
MPKGRFTLRRKWKTRCIQLLDEAGWLSALIRALQAQ